MDLTDYLDEKAGRIAYGVQRRVDVALAFIGRPQLLLMDEPGAGLSAAETLGLFQHLRDLVRERKIAAVAVEHDVDAIFACCDKVTVLDLGRHLATGTPAEIRADRASRCRLSRERGMSVLRIESLRAGYGASTVLHDVDLTVDEGESVALVGRNGAGKSTLLLSVFHETNISSGEIWVHDRRIDRMPGYIARKLGISISPRGRRILPNLTVKENLMLSRASGRKGRWDLSAVYELFPVLAERANRRGTMLSGGQQQMLGDRPGADGQPQPLSSGRAIGRPFARAHRRTGRGAQRDPQAGTGILVVEQHLNLVKRATDRFIILAKGEVVGSGPTKTINAPHNQVLMAL